MAISEVHHVGLTVADLERSIAFYRDILGFRKTLDMPLKGSNLERLLQLRPGTKARSVIMQAGRAITGEVELIAFDTPVERPSGPKRPGDPGVFMLSFEVKGETLAAASSLEKAMRERLKTGADVEAAKAVGKLVAERAVAKGLKAVVFDRGRYLYHGRVKALADAAREGGLSF